MADATRRAIIVRLAEGPLAVNAIAQGFVISRPAISRHLRVLRAAGLVQSRKAGRQQFYRIAEGPLLAAAREVVELDGYWKEHLARIGDVGRRFVGP